MRSKAKLILKLAILMTIFVSATAGANYLVPVTQMCNYRSLLNPDCVVCESAVSNYTRDYTMGAGLPPVIDAITSERLNPFVDEYANIKIKASSDGGAADGVGAQKLMAVEVSYTLSDGASWYTNNWDGARIGAGIPADSFTREVLVVKNQGTIMYKQYVSNSKPWAVSPESGAFDAEQIPAPNRQCEITPALCNKAKYAAPWNDDCPWGLTCPLYDRFPPNKGEDGGASGWPLSTCTQADGNCNVPGFPEGGGDLLDAFPSLDPYPMDNFQNVPGEPLIRVNGVPAVSCDIYNGVNRSPIHPLCESPIAAEDKAVYNKFGIYSYKVSPGQGMVRFNQTLDPLDKVDATFYSGDRTLWTAKLDLKTAPLSARNAVGKTFKYHAKVYDTCGNMATGAQSKPYPPFPGENNEAYVGVYDFYFDQVPTDQDPMMGIAKDDGGTMCSATDDLCPEDPRTTAESLAKGGCAEAGCECCFNECAPSACAYNGALTPNVSAQCSNVGASGNPPGCGPEFDHEDGDTHYGVQEIREFKMSHTAANLYLKTRVQGDVLYGCYGSWYPLIGCEYDFGTLGSKFLGYGAQLLNTSSNPPATFYLIVIPDIPIYGSIPLLIDLNKMLAELMGNAYDGVEMERYADGGGGCKKPGGEEDPGPTSCEQLGCVPEDNPSGDCDDDGYVNGTDSCPCDVAGTTTSDGCPDSDPEGGDPLAKYKCSSCQTGTQGDTLYVEMGIEDTVGDTGGGALQGLAMTLAIHNLDMNWLLYYACLNGMNLLALGQDQSPRISYYPTGARSRSEVEVVEDFTAPEELRSDKVLACLGRCDEPDVTDGADNDGDLAVLEPSASKRIDEGYDPTATQFEFRWQEPVVNNDVYKTNLIDLGGYNIQIGRGADGPFETLYTMCSPTASADCYGMNSLCEENSSCVLAADCGSGRSCVGGKCCMGGDRDMPDYDEPYNGVYSSEIRNRFPKPFNEDAPYAGFGFPGEPLSCVVDGDCDPSQNLFDDDKDGVKDEGCWMSNCYDNNTQLLPDGQAYWLRVRTFDIPNPVVKATATATQIINYTSYTTPVKVQILKNTWPPDAPDVVASYGMTYGGKVKVVWNPNKEADIGGYAVYRCPSNPLDAVIKTMDGTLAAYCANRANFRMVNKEPLDNLNGYFVDEGMGFYETGLGDGSATGPLALTWSSCSLQNASGQYVVDDKCNYDPIGGDLGVDGTVGGIMLGEGDGLPTPEIPDVYPGESFAYEWVDCSTLSTPAGLNEDLKLCGNIQDPAGAWWATGTSLFTTVGDPLYLYDVSTKPGYDPAAHPPILFYNGLVDGYTYYYFVKAVDSPYLGDGYNTIGDTDNCDDGVTPYSIPIPGNPTGCVNPILSRTCDDKLIAYNWGKGGNCSADSPTMNIVPNDIQQPQAPTSVSGAVQPNGRSVILSWNTPTEDRTQSSFDVYRAQGDGKLYACVHGGCDTAPYADGCQCDPAQPVATQCYQDPAGDWDRKCDKPVKICTNPPYYTIKAQAQGCATAPYNPGCVCASDSDCGTCGAYSNKTDCQMYGCNWDNASSVCSGLKCTWPTSICMIDQAAPPTGYAFQNDRIDNDGDGLIDEEIHNGIDDDGDGLLDEDEGILTGTTSEGFIVGKCPDKKYVFPADPADGIGYANESNWRSQERIIQETFNDKTVKAGKVYYYRVAAEDNAVFDPNDGSANDTDPPPPNTGLLSAPLVVDMRDTLPPSDLASWCYTTTGYAIPCVSIMDVTTYNFVCNDKIDDFMDDNYGGRISVRWRRNSDDDVRGYYVYRASDPTNSGIEPPSGAFTKVSEAMISQTPIDVATDSICFKDSGLQNGINYYYAVSAVDLKGNESPYSDAAGPLKAKDSVAPMSPTFGSSGGATPDPNGSKITFAWAEHSDYAAVKLSVTDPSETDFSHFRVYRNKDVYDVDGVTPLDIVCDQVPTATHSVDLCSNFGACTTSTDCGSGKTCDQGLCCTGGTTCCGGNLTESVFIDHFVAMDTKYHYCASAFDTNGNESALLQIASPVQAVDQIAPAAPTGLVASRLDNSEIGLGWKQSPETDIACYRPYFSGTSTNTGTFAAIDLLGTEVGYTTITNLQGIDIECVTELYFIHTNISASSNIYYRLTAIDSKGNESPFSDYVVTMPAISDFFAPPYPERLYTRAGYSLGESGGQSTDGKDNDGDGFIDGKIIKSPSKYAELYWDRVREPDTAIYELYRRDPSPTPNCTLSPEPTPTCDPTTDPLGDCDNDKELNSIDACPCIPTSPSTSQFGDYSLLATKTVAEVCPTLNPRPVGTQKGDICFYEEKTKLCPGSRYWYSVVPKDNAGFTNGLDKTYSMAVTPIQQEDVKPPAKPAKPKVAVTQSGKSLVVKFTENDPTFNDTVADNRDLAGYIIYRDIIPKGTYATKVAVINDKSKLNYCVNSYCKQKNCSVHSDSATCSSDPACSWNAGTSKCEAGTGGSACGDHVDATTCAADTNCGWTAAPPCYCDEVNPDLACVLDLSVEQKKRYYYKISAFDYSGNESELSDWNNATASPTAPAAVDGFIAIPKRGDDYALSLSWDAKALLDDPTVKGFLIYRADATDGTYQLLDPVPTTTTIENLRSSSFVDTGLKMGSTYWYMIVAESVDGLQSPSVKTCGVSGEDVFPPSTPIGVRPSSGDKSVTLNWAANTESDLAGYNIYRSASRDFKNSVLANTSPVTYPSFTDTDLVNGTTYYYCIKSFDDGPNFDTQGCYSGYPTESACSSPATIGFPTSISSSSSMISMVAKKGWNLIASSSDSTPSSIISDPATNEPVISKSLVRLSRSGSLVASDSSGASGPVAEPVAGAGFWYYSESDDPQQVFLSGSFLETGTVDIALSDGWNLVGSPFIADIIWTDQTILVSRDGSSFSAASSSPILKGAYTWNPDAGDYIPLKAGDSISAGTGIFLKSDGASTLRLVR